MNVQPTKVELLNKINEALKNNKSELTANLYYAFTDIGFYQEDKRKSKIKFAIACIDNCYKDNPNEYEIPGNREILEAVNTSIERSK